VHVRSGPKKLRFILYPLPWHSEQSSRAKANGYENDREITFIFFLILFLGDVSKPEHFRAAVGLWLRKHPQKRIKKENIAFPGYIHKMIRK
jgi:hypothetical protein